MILPLNNIQPNSPLFQASRGSSRGSRVADSGIWSPTKSMFSSDQTHYSNSIFSLEEQEDSEEDKHDPSDAQQLSAPRPSDVICEIAEEDEDDENQRGSRVYTEPIEEDIPEELDMEESESEDEFDSVSRPQSALKSPELTKPIESPAIGGEQDSDEDLLMNSDEDYEDERDDFFHKKKDKTLDLLKTKGITVFKKFLAGTTGEKHWLFWMDVERCKGIESDEELKR